MPLQVRLPVQPRLVHNLFGTYTVRDHLHRHGRHDERYMPFYGEGIALRNPSLLRQGIAEVAEEPGPRRLTGKEQHDEYGQELCPCKA
jgi:hypothetical protein